MFEFLSEDYISSGRLYFFPARTTCTLTLKFRGWTDLTSLFMDGKGDNCLANTISSQPPGFPALAMFPLLFRGQAWRPGMRTALRRCFPYRGWTAKSWTKGRILNYHVLCKVPLWIACVSFSSPTGITLSKGKSSRRLESENDPTVCVSRVPSPGTRARVFSLMWVREESADSLVFTVGVVSVVSFSLSLRCFASQMNLMRCFAANHGSL